MTDQTNLTDTGRITVDIAAVEREARRLRAETIARGLHNLRVWLTRPRASAGQPTA